ncbi:MAG: glycosyl transferase, partial [Candidatus Nanopelagicales bacterium]
MRILVVTVVHHPQDARIYFRQMAALLANGHQVSYAAAFDSFQVLDLDPRIETITLPRAIGKRRLSALLAVRKLLKQRSIDFDLVLLHDPELLIVA